MEFLSMDMLIFLPSSLEIYSKIVVCMNVSLDLGWNRYGHELPKHLKERCKFGTNCHL